MSARQKAALDQMLEKNKSRKKRAERKFRYSTHQIIGGRDYQEDRFSVIRLSEDLTLFLMCDGHRGKRCVEFVMSTFPPRLMSRLSEGASVREALRVATLDTHDAWAAETLHLPSRPNWVKSRADQRKIFEGVDMQAFFAAEGDSGTTLLAAVFDSAKSCIWLCHLGDSRALLTVEGRSLVETKDHSVPEVMPHTIGTPLANMGLSTRGGRVEDDLAMSGSIGDYTLEAPEKPGAGWKGLVGVLRMDPEISSAITIPRGARATLLLASDGLFETHDSQRVLLNPHETAKELVDEFGEKSFEDNVSVILVHIESEK